jgi:hypothetical protein
MAEERAGTYIEFIGKALNCAEQTELDSLLESRKQIFVKDSAYQRRSPALGSGGMRPDES